MSLSPRRHFLHRSGLWLAGTALLGCRPGQSTAAAGGPSVRAPSDRTVTQLLAGIDTQDGAGVRLTRVIGQPRFRNLDPFLLLDRFHSDDPGAWMAGFPSHPHRGFETVTVMLAGRMRHEDSQGNRGLIQGGGAQWMTAGRGIIHSEMPEQVEGLMSGFQLWVNLPASEKMGPRAYQDLQPGQLAEGALSSSGGKLRVISGEVQGLRGPVRERPTRPLLFTAMLEDDRPLELDLPEGHTAFLFVSQGEVTVGPDHARTAVPAGTLAVLGPGSRVRARAEHQRSELLFAAAKPLREPIVQRGPFVMNTEAEIHQAFEDYRRGVLDRS